MDISNFKFKIWATKQVVAFLLLLLPYLVAKVKDPAIAKWIEDNFPIIMTFVVASVTGIDIQSLSGQNAVTKRITQKD